MIIMITHDIRAIIMTLAGTGSVIIISIIHLRVAVHRRASEAVSTTRAYYYNRLLQLEVVPSRNTHHDQGRCRSKLVAEASQKVGVGCCHLCPHQPLCSLYPLLDEINSTGVRLGPLHCLQAFNCQAGCSTEREKKVDAVQDWGVVLPLL